MLLAEPGIYRFIVRVLLAAYVCVLTCAVCAHVCVFRLLKNSKELDTLACSIARLPAIANFLKLYSNLWNIRIEYMYSDRLIAINRSKRIFTYLSNSFRKNACSLAKFAKRKNC